MFSNDQVAEFVNKQFEPVWEMIRPVPIIRIDFGNGNVLTRTLHGNILTSVCTSQAETLDALPGIYEPRTYLDQLDQLRLLVQTFSQQPANNRERWLRQYHQRQAQRIARNQPPERFTLDKKFVPVGKGKIELPTERLLANRQPVPPPASNGSQIPLPPSGNAKELGNWEALAEDTRLNETTRRRQIHEMLAQASLVKPQQVLRPIYKDVLHADLDDPYLGLGKVLFESYPFAKEDAKQSSGD